MRILPIILTVSAIAFTPLMASAEGGHHDRGFVHERGFDHDRFEHRGGGWVGPAIVGGAILGGVVGNECWRYRLVDDGYGNLVRRRIYVC